MVFAKASSFTEHEEHGIEYWQRATAASKFQAIVELVEAGVIGFDDLCAAKRAAGRRRDLDDLKLLERFRAP